MLSVLLHSKTRHSLSIPVWSPAVGASGAEENAEAVATTNSSHGVPQNKNKVTDASFYVDSLGKSDEVVGKP